MIAAIAAALLPSAGVADVYPWLHEVTNAPENGFVNVYETPVGSGDAIASVPFGATNLEIITSDETGAWGMINVGERVGWIETSFLTRQRGQGQLLPHIRRCVGTEPFWAFDIDGAELVLTTPEHPPKKALVSGMTGSQSKPSLSVLRAQFFPGADGGRALFAMVNRELCSDGMSDRAYGLKVDLFLTDTDLSDTIGPNFLASGCCSIAPPAE